MPVYRINSLNQNIVAEQDFVDAKYPGDYTLLSAQSSPDPVYNKITAEAFWDRFTEAELLAFDIASQHVATDTVPNQTKAARLRQFEKQTNTSGFRNLSNAKTQAKMNGVMVNQGILTALRATEILSAPITADEAYTK